MRWTALTGCAALALASITGAPPVLGQDDVKIEVARVGSELAESVETAGGLEQMLGISKKELLLEDFRDDARVDFSYWPRPRAGLSVGQMTAPQREALQRLLASVLSSTGHLKVVHIMELENTLRASDRFGLGRDVENYSLAFFGQPSLTQPWSWRFEGHHVSINVTMAAGQLRVTPSFLGANPAQARSGPFTGFRPLRAEEDLGRALVGSLSTDQRSQAVLTAEPPGDIRTGTLGKKREEWDAWKTDVTPEGLALSSLQGPQRQILEALLAELLGTYRPELADRARQELDLGELHFVWLGGTGLGEPHYYRIQGGDFVFELDNVQQGGNHVHTIWRDRSRDFGDDLLQQHYQSSHNH